VKSQASLQAEMQSREMCVLKAKWSLMSILVEKLSEYFKGTD